MELFPPKLAVSPIPGLLIGALPAGGWIKKEVHSIRKRTNLNSPCYCVTTCEWAAHKNNLGRFPNNNCLRWKEQLSSLTSISKEDKSVFSEAHNIREKSTSWLLLVFALLRVQRKTSTEKKITWTFAIMVHLYLVLFIQICTRSLIYLFIFGNSYLAPDFIIKKILLLKYSWHSVILVSDLQPTDSTVPCVTHCSLQ